MQSLFLKGIACKKNIVLLMCGVMAAWSADASFDPFSVYQIQPPANCVEADLNAELTLPDLVQIGICTNPALNRDYMAVRATEAELGMAKAEYLPNIGVEASADLQNIKTEGLSSQQIEPYSASVGASWLLYDFGGQ